MPGVVAELWDRLRIADADPKQYTSDQLKRRWRLFLGLITFTTLLPYAVMPAAVYFGRDVNSLLLASALINFLGGNAHVAATAFFYSDPTMREHFREHKTRYVYAPAALIIGTGVAYALVPEPFNRYILLYYFLWQTYHYQRQNYGVLCFLAVATDRVPVSKLERLALELAAVAGMLALVRIYRLSEQTILQPVVDLIFRSASVIYMLVPVVVVIAIATEPHLVRNPLRIAGLILFSAFYVPSFIFSDPSAATLGYALGHGLQYLVFMFFVGISRPRPVVALTTITVAGLSGGFALTSMVVAMGHGSMLNRLLFGLAIGVVMSHFVIDAGVWKLRHQFQRRYVRAAFPFVFERK
jgi:hypothetical protein